ncbi:MAG: translation initiation factor IF-3 [Deltaproteobacteria bacterium]
MPLALYTRGALVLDCAPRSPAGCRQTRGALLASKTLASGRKWRGEGRRAIRRKKRFVGRVPRDRGPRKNHEIRVSPLRVVDENNQQIGVIERDEALRKAEEAGLDLVEIRADARPPLCKIMDYGKYKYQQSKKKSQSKAKPQNEPKEVRLGRSVKIDVHDVQLRERQARKFILEGHPVIVVQRFRGREMAHTEIGFERLQKMAESLSDVARVQTPPQMSGRQCSMVLAPDKNKVEAIKKQLAKEAAEEEAKKAKDGKGKAEEAPDDAAVAAAEDADTGDDNSDDGADSGEEQATANA